ncbi:MAG: hypothetical protein AB4290_23265 [Spirulina sp.]
MVAQIRQKAVSLVNELPLSLLPEAIALLESLSKKTNDASVVESRERQLVEIIQNKLPPEDRQRLDYLRDRNELEILTEAEHQELLEYVDLLEKQGNERLEAAIELAQMRNMDLDEILNEFSENEEN